MTLQRSGGLTLLDNMLWSGSVDDPEDQDEDTRAICALNDSLLRDERVTISLVPIGDGLTLARKRRYRGGGIAPDTACAPFTLLARAFGGVTVARVGASGCPARTPAGRHRASQWQQTACGSP